MGLEAPRTDYLGSNVSSTCNSTGSALWALSKNMKPLVDANCHTEAIETANERSPIQFSPILYNNPGSNSGHPAGQTILFGCRPELRTDGRQKNVPPIWSIFYRVLMTRVDCSGTPQWVNVQILLQITHYMEGTGLLVYSE